MGPAHLGVGLATKRVVPEMPLWLLLVASETLDLLTFAFEAVGLERFAVSHSDFQHGTTIEVPASVPWSHGLFMAAVWSVVAGAIVYAGYRDRRASGIIGLVVFSHWLLDVIVHPGLPLFFEGSPQVRLGLWMSDPGYVASIVLDVGLLVAGLAVYLVARSRGHLQVYA